MVFDVPLAVASRFTVEAKLKVLRAGEVFPDVDPFLRAQSWAITPLLWRRPGLGDRRGGEVWLRREGVDLFASCRRDKGGLRF